MERSHEPRRQPGEPTHDIAEALLRVMGTRGLHAVTMRAVAAEAGVSLHLVQHYFETKEQLTLFALRRLAEQMAERLKAKLAGTRRPREVLEAILTESIPADERSRIFHLAYTSYAVLAVTDEGAGRAPLPGRTGRDGVVRGRSARPGTGRRRHGGGPRPTYGGDRAAGHRRRTGHRRAGRAARRGERPGGAARRLARLIPA